MAKNTTILIILDGWGVGAKNDGNPLYSSNLQTIKYIEENFVACALKASGVTIGLPWGEKGSSEVGHLTLGAGRIIHQNFLRITRAIEKGDFFDNTALRNAFGHARENDSAVHLVGLLTQGHAHASIEHLTALIRMAKVQKAPKLVLHLFADGIDSSSRSVNFLLEQVKEELGEEFSDALSTITGRYWAMDVNKNWDRIEQTYKVIMGQGEAQELSTVLESTYNKDLNDEHIKPSIINKTPINDGDAVIFFNFREDGMSELARPFLDSNFNEFPRTQLNNVKFASMTRYFEGGFGAEVAFPPYKIEHTLDEVLSKKNKTQLKVAESIKWPHITYYFNGMKDSSVENEFRVKIPSDEVGKPEKNPQMMAKAITERILVSLQDRSFDFILANYANADAMAHTGNFQAVVEAAKTIDTELNRLVRATLDQNHTLVITSDHGNAEAIFDQGTGEVQTDHSENHVPFYVVGNNYVRANKKKPVELEAIGFLSDVAPTILDIMNMQKPGEMDGNSLLKSL